MAKYNLVTLAILLVLIAAACNSQAPNVSRSPSMTADASAFTTMPLFTPTIEPCAFVEATQNLTDVSTQIDTAIKQIEPEASGRAEAFGENCVFASTGQSTFSAMQTDFFITINVENLDDAAGLGTWIINSMKIVSSLPSESIPGPQAGFVEFTFKTSTEQKVLRVSIDKYKDLPANIHPSDVIPTLFPNP